MHMDENRSKRKVRVGVVLSDKMTKTRVVGVEWSKPHPLYKRRVRRITRFKVHDEDNATGQGDVVRIMETRRLSRDKRWRIVEVLKKAEVVELKPEEVDTSLLEELNRQSEAEAAPAAVAVEEAAPVAEAEAPAAEEAAPVAEAEATTAEEAAPVAEAEAPAAEEEKPKRASRAKPKAEAPAAVEEKPKRASRAKPKAEAPEEAQPEGDAEAQEASE